MNWQLIIGVVLLLISAYLISSGIGKTDFNKIGLWITRGLVVLTSIGIMYFTIKNSGATEKRIETLEEQVVINNYEDNKLNDLKNELNSYLSDNELESSPTIINIQRPPTHRQVEVVLDFLKNELANAEPTLNSWGADSNTINLIAGSIAKLFESSSSKNEFEKVIKDIANDTLASNEKAKIRILHGMIGYFNYDFEDKIDLMVELSENTIGLRYKNGKSPSISFEYFTNLMRLLRNQGNEIYFNHLNDKEFIDELNEKGILDEFNNHFPEGNGKRSNQYFNDIEETYLFQLLN